jgi:hypothetical protein
MNRALGLALAAVVLGCGGGAVRAPQARETAMDRIARDYVKLVLAEGEHDDGYVDAYYGPAEWREAARVEKASLGTVETRARALAVELAALAPSSEAETKRKGFLVVQIAALAERARIVAGAKLSFDEESRALYDAVAPVVADAELRRTVEKLDALVPGDGPLPQRLEAYTKTFEIPGERLDRVLRAGLDECRARTRAHVKLPDEESLTVEYVKDKPWGGYNWYQGGYKSVIQINTDLPVMIDRILDLACHEGYPGHHVANVLFEQHGVRERGYVELSVSPLRSPLALVMEGSANYGIPLAFSDEERFSFERDTLFPLAGIDPALAAKYGEVRKLQKELRYATNEAARRRIDLGQSVDEVARFLTELGGATPARARQSVRFIDANRSYVINYNFGEKLVGDYVARAGGGTDEGRWNAYIDLLVWPRSASALTP